MPEGKDPDDYIKQNGKDGLLNLLNDKQIIQSFIWNYHLDKVNQNNPFEISKFEKEIIKLSYSIQDETLKKYVLEDFLEKIKKLTPIQTSKKNYNYTKYSKQKDYHILKETKLLYQKRKDLSKTQIIEFSILFIILNYFEIVSKKIEELSEIEFLSKKNENLKSIIITTLTEENSKEAMQKKINTEYKDLSEEIRENSNIEMVAKDKTDQDILDLLNELILDFKEQGNLKKIESLENELINNLDENAYSELIKLKSQLNRE